MMIAGVPLAGGWKIMAGKLEIKKESGGVFRNLCWFLRGDR